MSTKNILSSVKNLMLNIKSRGQSDDSDFILLPQTNKQLQKISEVLKAEITVKFHRGSSKPVVLLSARNEEQYTKYEDVLAEHKSDNFTARLSRQPGPDKNRQFLDRIDFINLLECMTKGIAADIQALIDSPPDDPIYAFSVAISPDHNNIETGVNTEKEWNKTMEKHEKGSRYEMSHSDKYIAAHFTLEHAMSDFEHWAPYFDAVKVIDEIRLEELNFMNCDTQFHSDYMRIFTQMAVQALRHNLDKLNELNRTDDFVAYVEDYIGSQDGFFLALETVPLERLRQMMPEYK